MGIWSAPQSAEGVGTHLQGRSTHLPVTPSRFRPPSFLNQTHMGLFLWQGPKGFRLCKEECQEPWRSWRAFRNTFWLEARGRGHQLSSTLGTADRSQDRKCMGTHGCAIPRAHTARRPPAAAAMGSATGASAWAREAGFSPNRAPSAPKLKNRFLAPKKAFTKSRIGGSKQGLHHNWFFLEALASRFLFSSWLQIATSLLLTSRPISSPKLQGKPGMDLAKSGAGAAFLLHAPAGELLLPVRCVDLLFTVLALKFSLSVFLSPPPLPFLHLPAFLCLLPFLPLPPLLSQADVSQLQSEGDRP